MNLNQCSFTGYYAYLMSRRSSQTAVLQSAVLNDTGCLEFWYALNAIPKSFLNLKITHLDGNEASIWRQYGTGRTLGSRVKWLKASLPIYTGGIHKYQVRCYCIEVACPFDRVGLSTLPLHIAVFGTVKIVTGTMEYGFLCCFLISLFIFTDII